MFYAVREDESQTQSRLKHSDQKVRKLLTIRSALPSMCNMRTQLLLIAATFLLVVTSSLSAAELSRDDLMGFWQLDTENVSKEQKAAAANAAAFEGFGLRLTNRLGRAMWSESSMKSGMWRLDNATETGGTVVIQAKGGGEYTLTVTVTADKKDASKTYLTAPEIPGGLPLVRIIPK